MRHRARLKQKFESFLDVYISGRVDCFWDVDIVVSSALNVEAWIESFDDVVATVDVVSLFGGSTISLASP